MGFLFYYLLIGWSIWDGGTACGCRELIKKLIKIHLVFSGWQSTRTACWHSQNHKKPCSMFCSSFNLLTFYLRSASVRYLCRNSKILVNKILHTHMWRVWVCVWVCVCVCPGGATATHKMKWRVLGRVGHRLPHSR